MPCACRRPSPAPRLRRSCRASTRPPTCRSRSVSVRAVCAAQLAAGASGSCGDRHSRLPRRTSFSVCPRRSNCPGSSPTTSIASRSRLPMSRCWAMCRNSISHGVETQQLGHHGVRGDGVLTGQNHVAAHHLVGLPVVVLRILQAADAVHHVVVRRMEGRQVDDEGIDTPFERMLVVQERIGKAALVRHRLRAAPCRRSS